MIYVFQRGIVNLFLLTCCSVYACSNCDKSLCMQTRHLHSIMQMNVCSVAKQHLKAANQGFICTTTTTTHQVRIAFPEAFFLVVPPAQLIQQKFSAVLNTPFAEANIHCAKLVLLV